MGMTRTVSFPKDLTDGLETCEFVTVVPIPRDEPSSLFSDRAMCQTVSAHSAKSNGTAGTIGTSGTLITMSTNPTDCVAELPMAQRCTLSPCMDFGSYFQSTGLDPEVMKRMKKDELSLHIPDDEALVQAIVACQGSPEEHVRFHLTRCWS